MVGTRGSGRLSAMGEAGRMRVNKYFSFNAFASNLHDYVTIATGPDCSSELGTYRVQTRYLMSAGELNNIFNLHIVVV